MKQPIRLIRDMAHIEVIAAAQAASGRNWREADSFALTTFDDCARVEVYWQDGAADYLLHDSREEAVQHLQELGAAIPTHPA